MQRSVILFCLFFQACQGEAKVELRCRTPKTAAVTATGADAHGHLPQHIVLPLVGSHARCPRRGRIEIVLSSPAGSGEHTVRVLGLGAERKDRAPPGAGVALEPVPLAGLSTGAHSLEVEVDGKRIAVPAVEVTP
ncbi:MAG: hypothetical protein U1E65_06450 [Myxococcota bacterium]